jgi:hypothetical protein
MWARYLNIFRGNKILMIKFPIGMKTAVNRNLVFDGIFKNGNIIAQTLQLGSTFLIQPFNTSTITQIWIVVLRLCPSGKW